jgi:hypothetical protein
MAIFSNWASMRRASLAAMTFGTVAAAIAFVPSASGQKAAPAKPPAPYVYPPAKTPGPLLGQARFIGIYDGEQTIARARTTRVNRYTGTVVIDAQLTPTAVSATLEATGAFGRRVFSGTRAGNRCSMTSSIRDSQFEGQCDDTGFVGVLRSQPNANQPWTMRIDTAFIDVKDGVRYYDARHLSPVTGRVGRSEFALAGGYYRGTLRCAGRDRPITLRVFPADYTGQRGKIEQVASSVVSTDVEIVAAPDNTLVGTANRYRIVPTSNIGVIDYERKRHDLRLFGMSVTRDKRNLYGTVTDPGCGPVALAYSNGEGGTTMSVETFNMLAEALVQHVRTSEGGGPGCAESDMVKSGIPGHMECAFGRSR